MSEKENQANQAPAESPVLARVKSKFGGSAALIHTHSQKGDDTIVVRPGELKAVMEFLKSDTDLNFDMLMDLTVVDYLNDMKLLPYMKEQGARFELVLHLYSTEKNHRLRVKAPIKEETPQVDSVAGLWPSADWFEREAWDLYGIKFKGHPNLKRILLYEGFQGHPLRKDYSKTKRQPLIGPVN
ncbi:MAG: NADH-quinone oxidoreductase subunit C [Nitrospinae bacterium]|nr:NADH-quinone oxidoreductase subunit C [Nitrospinota bacterium]